jgi:anti-sigma regulatory factor (Ser/Thr protein kinase)
VARRRVRSVLTDAAFAPEVVDDAALVATELVANAVLHAGGPIGLALSWTVDEPKRVRVQVSDDSPSPPVARSYGSGASTGRGLALVASIATRWGVDRSDGGKVVWAELAAGAEPADAGATDVLSTMPAPPDVPLAADSVPVRFLGVPVAAYLRLQEQNDAVLRELELLAFTADAAGHVDPSPQLVDVIERSRRYFNVLREGFRGAVLEAASAGAATIDLDGTGSPSGIRAAEDFVSLLEDVERLADAGELLVSRPDREVARLRRWFVVEMAAQVEGRPPSAFSS